MKHIYFIISALIAIVSCKNNSNNNSPSTVDVANTTTVQWIDSLKNFGKIYEGDKVEIGFRFKNIGEKPLVITDVKPSCGCTIPNKPEKPIEPGAESTITAVFNSQGKLGIVHKTITVYANITGEKHKELIFEGEVLKKKE